MFKLTPAENQFCLIIYSILGIQIINQLAMHITKAVLVALIWLNIAHSLQEIPFLSFTSIVGNGYVPLQLVAGDQIVFTVSYLYSNPLLILALRISKGNTFIGNNVQGANSVTDSFLIPSSGKYYFYFSSSGRLSKISPVSYLIKRNGAVAFSNTFQIYTPSLNYFLFSVIQQCDAKFILYETFPSLTYIFKLSDIYLESQAIPIYDSSEGNKTFTLLPNEYILISYQIPSGIAYGVSVSRKLVTFCDKMCKSQENIFQQQICSQNCGDGIKSAKEDCDNGNKTGCSKNCIPDKNYNCYGPVGSTSFCLKDAVCGDGILDLGQECDTGSKAGCSSGCKLDAGYKCTQQTGKPSLCSLCGNGILEYGEECDNRNQAGCSANCRVDVGFSCRGVSPSVCLRKDPVCGNGVVEIAEMCDDGNLVEGDGCSRFCRVETGFGCLGEFGYKSSCSKNQIPVSVCGNSVFEPFASSAGLIEQCDNGNQQGCQGCVIQSGFFCSSMPGQLSSCFAVVAPSCGNGILDIGEQCEDGNIANGDGCNNFCNVEFGWTCRIGLVCTRNQTPPPPATQPFCGNGKVEQGEQCDDGFPVVAGDGCNTRCRIQQGWVCQIAQDLSRCIKA